MNVCEPCGLEGGPLLTPEGNQSPLSLRPRRLRPRMTSALPLLERTMWDSFSERK